MRRNPWGLRQVGLALCIVSLVRMAAAAQTPPAAGGRAAESQPTTQKVQLPQEYRVQPNQILAYKVSVTTRLPQAAGTSLMEQFTRQDMYVVNVEADGTLVVYQGMAKPVPATAGPAKGQSQEGKPPEVIYTRYVLGKTFTREEDGTIRFRPDTESALPVPFLPLPPAQAKEAEAFELTMTDMGSAGTRTLPLRGRWRWGEKGRLAVTGTLSPEAARGLASSVDMASYEYQMAATPSCVTSLKVNERTPPELAKYAMPGRLNVQQAEVVPSGQAKGTGIPLPRPQNERQMTMLQFELAGAKPISQEQHDGLVEIIRKAGVKEPGAVLEVPPGSEQTTNVSAPGPHAPPAKSTVPRQMQDHPRTTVRGMTEDVKNRADTRNKAQGQ